MTGDSKYLTGLEYGQCCLSAGTQVILSPSQRTRNP